MSNVSGPAVPNAADLRDEATRLATVSSLAVVDGSVWWLDERLVPAASMGRHLWITARMSHVLNVALLQHRSDLTAAAEAATLAIDEDFADTRWGGWYPAISPDGTADSRKTAYEHAFVLLAAATATLSGRAGATSLLRRAIAVIDDHFWDDDLGVMRESFEADWTSCEPYIGANANMHSVEAFIATADATGNDVWIERATRIARRFADVAQQYEWRLPEHYSPDLLPDLDYNKDVPNDQFRPPGATPGHGFEWARLLATLFARDESQAWALKAARRMFLRAYYDGWDTERGGLCYTTDFDGKPLVTARFHWVHCEAALAGTLLAKLTGDDLITDQTTRIWHYTWTHFPDRVNGGWHHELDVDGCPASTTWWGKPDTYHAFQACLAPDLRSDRSIAASFVAR